MRRTKLRHTEGGGGVPLAWGVGGLFCMGILILKNILIKGELFFSFYLCMYKMFVHLFLYIHLIKVIYRMDNLKARLEIEQKELEDKLNKLDDFLNSDESENIEKHQQALLFIQSRAMATYFKCLEVRLASL